MRIGKLPVTMIFVLSLTLASTLAHADKKAKIRWSYDMSYSNTMEVIAKDRVSGRLRSLEVTGDGEEESIVFACYEGSKKDICELLEIAVAEENDKRDSDEKKLKLKKCEYGKNDNIIAVVESKNDGIRLPVITVCK